MQARHILFVNRFYAPDESATSRLLTDLATALAAKGFNVSVICSRQLYDQPHVRLRARESIAEVSVNRIWTTRFGRRRTLGRALDYGSFYIGALISMLVLLRRGDIVVAETDPPLLSIAAAVAGRLKGAELINWLQDIFPEVASLLGANPLPRALDRVLRRCRDWSLRYARLNVVIGTRMCQRVQDFGIVHERIRIVPNWAHPAPGAPLPAGGDASRARWGLPNHFVVAYSGNLGRAHEFETVLKAAQLLSSRPEIVFLMIGGGSGMVQMQRVVQTRKLANFRFEPYQSRENLHDSLAAADVHWVSLLPNLEGYIVPSKFYGILAVARPVIFIGDQNGELAREINACQCGITIAIEDGERLANVLIEWQQDRSKLQAMGERGYRRFREYYSAEEAIRRWGEVFTSSRPAAGVSSQAALGQ